MMIDCLYYLGLIHVITFIVQAFPGFEDIGQSFFASGVINLRWIHNCYNSNYSNLD